MSKSKTESVVETRDGRRLVRLPSVVRALDMDRSSIWRIRRRGWLRVTNIGGRLFCTQTDLNEFIRRARRGDFARRNLDPKTRQLMGAS
jgi:hypothetical protein